MALNLGVDSFDNPNDYYSLGALMERAINSTGVLNYQLCKQIYLRHPLGKKLVESSLNLALAKGKKISIEKSPGEEVSGRFLKVWKDLKAEELIYRCAVNSKIYGVASLVMFTDNELKSLYEPIDYQSLYKQKVNFSVFDPLIVSGSFTSNQDPLDPNFMNMDRLIVRGGNVDGGRFVNLVHGEPIYLSYTNSAFGYTGTSIYQNALEYLYLLLKHRMNLEQGMDKAGSIVVKHEKKSLGVDGTTEDLHAKVRETIRSMSIGNVVSLGEKDSVESFTMAGVSETLQQGFDTILSMIASSTGLPSQLLMSDGYKGFLANGTEDFKQTLLYVENERRKLDPLYAFMERIVQHIAWSPDFYNAHAQEFAAIYRMENGELKPFDLAFAEWRQSFKSEWLELVQESKTEQTRVDIDVCRSIIETAARFFVFLKEEEKPAILAWARDSINERANLTTTDLIFNERNFAAGEDITENLSFLQGSNKINSVSTLRDV